MVIATQRIYTEDDLLALGPNAPFELIRGELRAVTPTSLKPSVVGGRVFGSLYPSVDQHDLGYLTNADGGYVLSRRQDTVIAPDVGFIHRHRLPDGLPETGYCPLPPDFAAEVISPTDEPSTIADKHALYELAGVRLVWWIDPRAKEVRVLQLGQPVRVLTDVDVLDGGDVFPGFLLPVANLFRP